MPTATSDPRALYLDASALVKLVVVEPETRSLRDFVEGRDLVSSELVVAEVSRAVARHDGARHALRSIGALLDGVALIPLTRAILQRAGSYAEPTLRTLDAIHVASLQAVVHDVERFVSYDRRQAAVVTRTGTLVSSPA